jgi:hypothetical protein
MFLDLNALAAEGALASVGRTPCSPLFDPNGCKNDGQRVMAQGNARRAATARFCGPAKDISLSCGQIHKRPSEQSTNSASAE